MAMTFSPNHAVFAGIVSVEDAEPLLEEALAWSDATLDLHECTHLHPASLQVLLAAPCRVERWPSDPVLAAWLASALKGPVAPHLSFTGHAPS